ncbi:SDR family oxidoreductase [Zooshikella ganghwensis]|uniref:NAD(P)-dependent oxidoreductase n=1 Tax=Zooshikella ganghwensis TaxID=202772 RepID=A0A4P9VRS3_9GAMM|nr:NAD(P)-dependent oxidoreductase [Zooshikella ganghwensis]RDH45114.1 NAD(P)-dependent oxidoreductase [Zooshikella ganghwensis]
MTSMENKTIVITGASRGIGRAIALKCAAAGANIVVTGKTSEPHSKLPGTIHSVAAEVEAAGGKALAVQMDVRDEQQIQQMVTQTVERFGGIDALINNAGAIKLLPVETLPIKRYDLMQQVNSRALFICAQAALPYLKKSSNPHILSLSPPISLQPKWLKKFAPYTLSKYGMTILALGMAEEFKKYHIAVNTLWPKTVIATAAVAFEVGSEETFQYCRTADIMADAAFKILSLSHETLNGQTLVDESFLKSQGISDFEQYRYDRTANNTLMNDLFIDDE